MTFFEFFFELNCNATEFCDGIDWLVKCKCTIGMMIKAKWWTTQKMEWNFEMPWVRVTNGILIRKWLKCVVTTTTMRTTKNSFSTQKLNICNATHETLCKPYRLQKQLDKKGSCRFHRFYKHFYLKYRQTQVWLFRIHSFQSHFWLRSIGSWFIWSSNFEDCWFLVHLRWNYIGCI